MNIEADKVRSSAVSRASASTRTRPRPGKAAMLTRLELVGTRPVLQFPSFDQRLSTAPVHVTFCPRAHGRVARLPITAMAAERFPPNTDGLICGSFGILARHEECQPPVVRRVPIGNAVSRRRERSSTHLIEASASTLGLFCIVLHPLPNGSERVGAYVF